MQKNILQHNDDQIRHENPNSTTYSDKKLKAFLLRSDATQGAYCYNFNMVLEFLTIQHQVEKTSKRCPLEKERNNEFNYVHLQYIKLSQYMLQMHTFVNYISQEMETIKRKNEIAVCSQRIPPLIRIFTLYLCYYMFVVHNDCIHHRVVTHT